MMMMNMIVILLLMVIFWFLDYHFVHNFINRYLLLKNSFLSAKTKQNISQFISSNAPVTIHVED